MAKHIDNEVKKTIKIIIQHAKFVSFTCGDLHGYCKLGKYMCINTFYKINVAWRWNMCFLDLKLIV
jgi:hypothetical protein